MSLENNWVDTTINWKSGGELYSSTYEDAAKKHAEAAEKEKLEKVNELALDSLDQDWELVEIDIEQLKEIAKANPDNKEIAKIVSLMTSSGAAIYSSGAGAVVAEAAAGLSTYMYAVPSNSGLFWQYFGSVGAGKVASTAINFTVCGISAAVLSNVTAAVVGGYCVGKLGEAAYNRFYAQNEEEKINISFTNSAKQIFGAVWK